MFTLFDLLELIGLVAGGITGFLVGVRHFGIGGAIVGTALGAFAGFVVGRLPFVIGLAWVRWDLRCSSVASLRERARGEYYVSHLILAELAIRGEPPESFKDIVLAQLASPQDDVRGFGLTNARVWFPDLASAPIVPRSSDAD
jgi:hypothetical protein